MERYAPRKHCSLSTAAGRDEREDQVRHVELKSLLAAEIVKDVKPPDGMPPLQSLKSFPLDIDKALAEQTELLAWWRETTGVK